MAKIAPGFIPDKIRYVYANDKEVPVGCEWDISWSDSSDGPKTVKKMVKPTFPIEEGDAKALTTATRWAENSEYDYQNPSKKVIVRESIVDNKPLKNVKVLSLEHRGQGGRAYKALIGDYYVDLREDVLMDTLLKAGVGVDGELKGEYIWAKLGAHMKLVRVGSELHRLILDYQKRKTIKVIGKRALEVGGVYQDLKKNKSIFLGYVQTSIMKSNNPRVYQGFGKTQKAKFEFNFTPIKKAMLFLPVYDHIGDAATNLKNTRTKEKNSYFAIKKSHNFIEKIDEIKIPKDMIEWIRNDKMKYIKDSVLEYVGKKTPRSGWAVCGDFDLESRITYASEFLNMSKFDETPLEPFDVKKLLLFT